MLKSLSGPIARASRWLVLAGGVLASGASSAAFLINDALPIEGLVRVQPIVVSNTDGSNTATFFGNAAQQTAIEGLVDSIWAQAGIDIEFLAPTFLSDDFVNLGTTNPRPTSDLSAMVNAGNLAGVTSDEALNMFLVRRPAGFNSNGLTELHVAGLGFIGGNGISQFIGEDLLGISNPAIAPELNGQEAVASVVAHEIGHNLGLSHPTPDLFQNLMNESGPGQRLTSEQIQAALSSEFVTAVPLPAGVWLLISGVAAIAVARRRAVGQNA